MLNFSDNDKKILRDSYKMILLNLKEYLKQYGVKDEIEYSRIFIDMLHSGLFSMNGKINFDNNFAYLGLPVDISQGVQVMYGVCCCRHATEFLFNLLNILDFDPSLLYVFADSDTGIWHRVNPATERANHQAIILKNKCIVDPANKFILKTHDNGELTQIDSSYIGQIRPYQEESIETVGKVLKKYYTYKEMGIERVYS